MPPWKRGDTERGDDTCLLRFDEIEFTEFSPRTIILDVDGTILADGESELAPAMRAAIERTARIHQLVIVSNNRERRRVESVADAAGVPMLATPYRKPDPRIVAGFTPQHPLLVVGDKYLTDERFARAIGAEYLRVSRLTSPEDSLAARLTYAMDDTVSSFISAMNLRT